MPASQITTRVRSAALVVVATMGLVGLGLGACQRESKSNPPPAKTPASPPLPTDSEPRIHRAFSVSRIYLDGHSVTSDPWRMSSEVSPKAEVKVAVIASWCGASMNYLAKLSGYPKGRMPVDFIVFYEDEVVRGLDQMEREGRLTYEQRQQLEIELLNRDQHLIDPGAPARYDLEYWFIAGTEFRGLVDHYPSLLACGPDGCKLLQ